MANTLMTRKQVDAEIVAPVTQAVADELHRRARRIVDRVVTEAMEQITGKRKSQCTHRRHIIQAGVCSGCGANILTTPYFRSICSKEHDGSPEYQTTILARR